MRKGTALTQKEVVTELKYRGYADISERRIVDWRHKGLLPPFDEAGGGLGKSLGRSGSTWSDGELVLKQAVSVYNLVRLFRRSKSLYLPLWMLGYQVPMSFVRKALNEPLSAAIRDIEEQTGSNGDLQDVIDQIAADVSEEVRARHMAILQVPQEWLEVCVSTFFVPDYPLSDAPYQHSLDALHRWQRVVEEQLAVVLGKRPEEFARIPAQDQNGFTRESLLAFLNRYLSLRQLSAAVQGCSDEQLHLVQNDMKVLVETAVSMWRMVMALTRDFPAELKPDADQSLAFAFDLGRLLVWANISLRHNGFGDAIDRLLSELKSSLQDEAEETARLFEDFSQDFANVFSHTVDYLEETARSACVDGGRYSYYGIEM
jgi:hypothetical protein